MYKHRHNTLTINSISFESAATLIHYVYILAKQFHNLVHHSWVWSNLDSLHTSTSITLSQSIPSFSSLNNVDSLRTRTGKTVLQSTPSVSSLRQPWLTTYKHWHNTYTIDLISLESEATSIHFVQAPAQHFHNRFTQSRVCSNLDSLCTRTGKAVS